MAGAAGAEPEGGTTAPTEPTRMPRGVAFGEALRFWLKLGFVSFGGPAGQIAIMHRELVERRRWISEGRFLHALNFCMLLPGPEAQQLATYIGWLLHRVPGGLVAGLLFILPSVFILLGLSYLYAVYGHLPVVIAALAGCKPAVVAIVLEAVVRIGRRALVGPLHLALAAAAFVAIRWLDVPFPAVVLGAGQRGLLVPSSPAAPARAGGAEVLADDSPLPVHARPSLRRTLATLAVGLGLWLAPLLALLAWRGGESLHVQVYHFFTRAALVTFGGAYAVLAYVTQAAVDAFGWVSAAQAIDGLALAETTPGPLIMVLQFIGFQAGWNHPGGLEPAASGALAAAATTHATFLPCFLFIFLGAPYVERLRGERRLAAALAAVTAAVVGVILDLGLVFGEAVVFPQGWGAPPSAFAAGLAVAALLALALRTDILWVVLAAGALGVVRLLLGGAA
jgi:chromate transporter